MEIESIRHKGLRRFASTGSARGVIEAERVADMLAFLAAAGSMDDLMAPPNFGFHALKGNRAGTYAMTVTRNWRLVFGIDQSGAIIDLDLEDYH